MVNNRITLYPLILLVSYIKQIKKKNATYLGCVFCLEKKRLLTEKTKLDKLIKY